MMQFLILCIFILQSCFISADNSTSLCNSLLTCGECIRNPTCAWCSEENVHNTPRCFRPNLNLPYISEDCNHEHVYFPTSTIQLNDFTKQQLKPEEISLQLKVSEPIYFSVDFIKNENDTDLSFELKDDSSKYLSVKYISKCIGNYTAKTFQCNNSTGSRLISFHVEVQLKTCPIEPDYLHQHFRISLQNNSTEYVQVKVEMLCSCPCEHPGSLGYEFKAKQCNAVGTLKCGVCHCDLSHIGERCECPLKHYSKIGCKPPNATEDQECSGRGACICNKCVCNNMRDIRKKIFGNFCECDNFSCERRNGKICSGNGVCNCGICSCHSRYTGNACECFTGTSYCYPPFKKDALICNGHGACVCGKCHCHMTGNKEYKGKFCEKSLTVSHTCNKLKPCVLCQVYHKGPYNNDECNRNCNTTVTIVDEVKENITQNEFLCQGHDESGCVYRFTYQDTRNDSYIKASKEVHCL